MILIRLVLREVPENLRSIILMATLSAISTTALLALVEAASKAAEGEGASARLVLMFLITVMLFGVTHNYVLITASQDVERLIHRLRVGVFEAVRHSDLPTVEGIGRAALEGALTQSTQTLATTLPLLVIAGQQALMLVFLGGYMAWLSPLACLLAFGFASVALITRLARMRSLGREMNEAAHTENAVFDGLTDLLDGFKEVRMSRARADALRADLIGRSAEARRANTAMKARWGWEFALLQAMFFMLIGLMVFVVPLFTQNFHQVVVPAVTVALFIVGPIGTLAHVAPMVMQTESALADIEGMRKRLADVSSDEPRDGSGPPVPAPQSIVLAAASFAYRDREERELFAVGPLSVEFRAGEIAFITGGNGSGKSTMMRLITGLVPLASGTLLADGVPIDGPLRPAYRDNISAVFSDFHLSRRLLGIASVDPERAAALIGRMGMADKVCLRDGAFSTVALSTGQRKRLALIVAELEDKPIVVLDEWAADQDPHFRRAFYEEILPDLRSRGKIVICVTHDDRWFHVADHIHHMSEGKFVK